MQSFNVFDFLREIVSKVPDLGCSDASGRTDLLPKEGVMSDNL